MGEITPRRGTGKTYSRKTFLPATKERAGIYQRDRRRGRNGQGRRKK